MTASPEARADEIEERVAWWLDYWNGRGAAAFARGMARMGRYRDLITGEIGARGLPPSLLYLPLIEANYYPGAVSPVGAAGIWQFMPATARWLGLRVGPLVDLRFDAFASTPVALDYLVDLNRQFDSWFLTLAAYNAGPGRVETAVRRYGGDGRRSDATYLRIRDRLPAETRDFVPKYLAAVRLATDPGRREGWEDALQPTLSFDIVTVDGAASLGVIARTANLDEEEVADLNRHLRASVTPAEGRTVVRLPPGAASGFAERFAMIPPRQRVERHVVAAGENFWRIARSYRIPLESLEAANPGHDPRRLQIGTSLVLPWGGAAANNPAAAAPPVAAPVVEPPSASGEDAVHVVARGESLWLIARYHGVELARLRAYNGLAVGAVLKPGDRIRIPSG